MDLTSPTLVGRLVRLEPLALRHVDGLCAIGLEPSLWALTQSVVRTAADLRAYVDEALAARADGSQIPFATIEQATGTVIGSTRFGSMSHEHRRLEIGWSWLGTPWQRSGANTDAKYLMLCHAFEVMQARRVELKTHALNIRSRDAMRRLGATEEGTFRQHMLQPDGSSRDSVYFSIIDREWPAVRTRLEARLGIVHGER